MKKNISNTLNYQILNSNTKKALQELLQYQILNNFYLVGGTALSLYLGHRKSIDLDFFLTKNIIS